MVSIIAAYTNNRVLGMDGDLPWDLPIDRDRFTKITDSSTVIMGRKTYESIAKNSSKPLSNRRNIVISRTLTKVIDGFELTDTLDKALKMSNSSNSEEEVFVIGGGNLFDYALRNNLVDEMYLTEIDADIKGDAYFPEFDKTKWIEVSRKSVPKNSQNIYDVSFVVLMKITSASTKIDL